MVRRAVASAIFLFVWAPDVAPAQHEVIDLEAIDESGHYRLPQVLARRECAYGPQDPDAIVVCGRRRGQPQGVAPRQPDDPLYRAERSWGSRVRAFNDLNHDLSQAVGPFGYLQHGSEAIDRWREERREIVRHRRW
jgi:hypothetical protein